MKFCVLSSLSSRSGSSIRNRGICGALGALGHEVDYSEPCGPEGSPGAEGFRLHRLSGRFSAPALWVLPALCANLALLRAVRPGAVMVMKPFPHTALPALLARALYGSRVAADFDDLDSGYASGPLARRVIEAMQLFFLKRADTVCVHNAALREYLVARGIPGARVTTLAQGITPEKYGPPRQLPELPAGWDRAVTLVYAAHLGPAAALGPLLEIFAGLGVRYRLLVIGGGELQPELERKAEALGVKDRVRFTGYLPHEEALAYMRRGSIAVNFLLSHEPRDRYRSQIKVREYLALGLPVVSSRGGDIELFGDFVEIAEDAGDFARKVEAVAADPAAAARRAAAGRDWVLKNFAWPAVTAAWLREAGLER